MNHQNTHAALLAIIHQEAGRTLSRDDFELCMRVAKRAVAASAYPALPERDTSRPIEQQGLFHKFDVRRTDGTDAPGCKHHGCRYFVLDLDHDAHAPAALRAYAASCAVTHPQLSADLVREFGTSLPSRALTTLELKTAMCFDTPPCAGVAKPLTGKEQA